MIDYKNVIKQAPLPFVGQKRYFVKKIYEYFKSLDYKPGKVVDCFGGSGLLSNLFKQMYPEAEVVYNDYDNYMGRVEQVANTNKVLEECRKILAKHNIEPKARITEPAKIELEEYLNTVDWNETDRNTVYVNFSLGGLSDRNTLYINKLRQSDYVHNEEYCRGCKIVTCDYEELIQDDRALYILDPPYIQTNSNTYKNWFSIADFLKLYERIKNLDNFILFTSYRSGAYDVLNYLHKDIKTFSDDILESKSCAGISTAKGVEELAYIRLRGL